MKQLFLFLVLLCFVSCDSEPISKNGIESPSKGEYELTLDEAKSVLIDFLNEQDATKNSRNIVIKDYSIHNYEITGISTKANIKSKPEKIPVFEFITETNKNKGYSLVVGDKRISKVLAFIEKGTLNDTSFIPPLKMFYESIPELINNDLESYSNNPPVNTKSSNNDYYYAILPTSWGQGYPYNKYCPPCSETIYDSYYRGKCRAGCASIAIAQIMVYHQHPETLHNMSTDFDWTNILAYPFIDDNSPSNVIDQVANLVNIMGVSVGTNYQCYASGTNQDNVPAVFSWFGYTMGNMQEYSLDTIKNSLQNRRPVFITASAYDSVTTKRVGHAWVCDGWYINNYSNYLHFNWGWDGTSNGYYYVPDSYYFIVNPSYQGGRYTFSQDIYIIPNIRVQ